MPRHLRTLVLASTTGFIACSATEPQTAYWDALQALCGEAFEGHVTENVPDDPTLSAARLVMHLRECSDTEIRIPFFVDDDRSRTWVLSHTDTGLRLKHDHRHEDGSEDSVTQYGGDTANEGSKVSQDFHADAFTADLLPASATNIWTLEMTPGRTFAYALRRSGSERRFRAEFDLSSPIEPPPAPWGVEPIWQLDHSEQLGKVMPTDEASQDESFLTFRTELIDALERRDTTFVFGHVADDVRNGFGGDGGIDEFREYYWTDEFADDLVATLRLGGRFEQGRFWAPYTQYPLPHDLDPFTHAVAITDRVLVYDRPDGEPFAVLSHDVVEVLNWSAPDPPFEAARRWVHIRLANGGEGVVSAAEVRSPLDLRVWFEKIEGGWILRGWAAGD